MRNITSKLPEMARPTLKKLIGKAFTSNTRAEGLERAQAIIEEYRELFPAAMKCLEQDLEETLMVLRFPFVHRKQIRSNNFLERLFGKGKRRTNPAEAGPRFTSEASGLSLVFAVLLHASEGWRRVRMKPYLEERLRQMMSEPDSSLLDPHLARFAA